MPSPADYPTMQSDNPLTPATPAQRLSAGQLLRECYYVVLGFRPWATVIEWQLDLGV